MDAIGNLMLGLWFMVITGACLCMAFLIFKDHRPVRRDKLGYFVWTLVAVALIIFSMMTFGIGVNAIYKSNHLFLLWIRS